METLIHDLRYGFRALRKAPAFSAIAVLMLALGIGASTAIYSVVYAILLRPLPYPDPERIVTLWEQASNGGRMKLADPNFEEFRAQNRTLSAIAEYSYAKLSVAGGSEAVRVIGANVSQDFFLALGVQPFLGRSFTAEELRLNGTRATIVSYGYWQRYLGSSPELSKFSLAMNGGVYSVIGVMPRGFDFPKDASLWIARELDPPQPNGRAHNFGAVARIRDGITLAQARADLDGIAKRILAVQGRKVDLMGAAVIPLAETLVGDVRAALLTLFGVVSLLFFVACCNVAGLLLARTLARRKELAVRAALGAGLRRLVQQLLAESFVLCFAGGALGILVATWTTNLLPAILPADLPRQQGIAINAPVLLFAVVATLAAAAGLGLFAAWRSRGRDLLDALNTGSRSYSSGSQKARSLLVMGQLAATLVMLATAGLLGRSFLKLISVSPGFSGQNLMIFKFSLPQSETALTLAALREQEIARQVHFADEVLAQLRSLPGVESAGLSGGLPLMEGFPSGTFLNLNGQPPPTSFDQWGRLAQNPKNTGHAYYCAASEGYFQTLDIPLIRGRMFSTQEGPDAPNVALISETLARQRWPNEDPIGRVIHFGNMDGNLKPMTIIGIVGDIRARGLDQPLSPIIYVDFRQRGLSVNISPTIVLRPSLPASSVVPSVRSVFRSLDPNVPVEFSTFEQALGGWLAARRFLLLLISVFAGVALVLAAVGIYGMVAHSVARRTQEIGIRMALGAQSSDVLHLIVGEAARLIGVSLLIGFAASFAATRWISSLLVGVNAADWLTFLVVAVVLSFVALLASYIPARRAMCLDPNTVLRDE